MKIVFRHSLIDVLHDLFCGIGGFRCGFFLNPGLFSCFLCAFLVNAMLYFFSFYLSLRFRNQVTALAVGFCGALIGLFAAYMPTWFGYFVPFGYYVPLNGVLMNWDRDTRITTFYLTDFRWWLLGVTVLLGLLCAAACRRSIQTKEV